MWDLSLIEHSNLTNVSLVGFFNTSVCGFNFVFIQGKGMLQTFWLIGNDNRTIKSKDSPQNWREIGFRET